MAPNPLICRAQSLHACLCRLRATNDAVIFKNADETLRIMLRNDPQENPDTMCFDLSVVWDDNTDVEIAKIMDLEHDGYIEEPGVFVLDSFSNIPAQTHDSPELDRLRLAINHAHELSLCHCMTYLIKDGGSCCVFCTMTADEGDLRREFCPICQDSGIRLHMAKQSCCNQFLHASCLRTWNKTSSVCPMCRTAREPSDEPT